MAVKGDVRVNTKQSPVEIESGSCQLLILTSQPKGAAVVYQQLFSFLLATAALQRAPMQHDDDTARSTSIHTLRTP